jgi:hypothetical protein
MTATTIDNDCGHEIAALKYDRRTYGTGTKRIYVPARCILCGKDLPSISVSNRTVTLSGSFDLGIVRRRKIGFNDAARLDNKRRIMYEILKGIRL